MCECQRHSQGKDVFAVIFPWENKASDSGWYEKIKFHSNSQFSVLTPQAHTISGNNLLGIYGIKESVLKHGFFFFFLSFLDIYFLIKPQAPGCDEQKS